MASDEETRTTTSHPPPKKNKTHIRIAQNGAVGSLVAWGGAFAFACLLAVSTFKRSKKIRSAEGSKDDGGSGEIAARYGGEAPQMEGLRLLLQSSSTDFISSCRTAPEMSKKKAFHTPMAEMTTSSAKHVSVGNSDCDENRTPPAPEPIGEMNEGEKMVVIIYEEEQDQECRPDSEKSVQNDSVKYEKIPKVAEEGSSIRIHDNEATWLAEWTSDELSSSSEEEEEEEEEKKLTVE